MTNGEAVETSESLNEFSSNATPESPTEFFFNEASLLKIVDYFILGLSLLLLAWMIYDSIQRFKNKWLFPLIAIIISFLPFTLASMMDSPNPYYWLASTVVLWLLYLFIRPEYTREEMRMLESEQKIKDITRKFYERELLCKDPFCPVCGLPVKEDFLLCPHCFKELRTHCPQCKKLVDKTWTLCPYCKSKLKQGARDDLKDF